MFEHATLPAAKLRERYGLVGTKPLIAERFRDKVVMKSALRNSGIRYPHFVAFDEEEDISAKIDELFDHSAKVIVKPKSQAAAQGIHVFTNKTPCVDYLRELDDLSDVEAEEFIEGRLLHFDGLYEHGAFRFFSVSEYFHGCFEVVHEGQHLVSYTIDDPDVFSRVQSLGLDVIRELGLERGVFHGEVFRTRDDDLVFLEIGNRFGGAGVSPTLKMVFDFDIVAESIRVDLGQASLYSGPARSIDTGKVDTYVYITLPTTKLYEVKRVNGLELLPDSVLHHETPTVGDKLNIATMPFPSSGKFILKNSSSEQAQKDARDIIREYSIEVGVISDE
ncbi:ATP-grasp domain-containing protein [Xenorhabdus khoisanae]|uniref:ATP-grasp domain-containing protein n=1 Tax=Xenorhabdus khoisanae TaxID=880157 RepID=UPI002359C449|nr:ATP-grasp domain-containing protein [Xenorhabdus khoisanae]MDC9613628.1 ATP-grasp domain-containing protein [Xenorhabdus khoisanae]